MNETLAEDGTVGNETGGGFDPNAELVQSSAELDRLDNKLEQAGAYLTAYRHGRHRSKKAPVLYSCSPDPALPCGTPDNSVALTQVAQSKNYYCGPASGVMILRSTNQGNSDRDGASLTQVNVANNTYMQTDLNGKTGWDTGLFRIGLNRWRNDSFYVNLPHPTNFQFKASLASDIDRGYTFGLSTVEFANGAHYNFHPSSQLIGHWVTAHGYTDSLANVKIADPAAGSTALSSAWASVQPKFTAGSNNFNQTYLQSNGITW